MSFATKLLQSSTRVWHGIAGSRGFHVLMRPVARSMAADTSSNQGLAAATATTSIHQGLLLPLQSIVQQVAGFKVKGRLKRRCKDCYVVIRQERGYVICPTHPRHKQMAMKKRDYKSWILTHATQSKERGF